MPLYRAELLAKKPLWHGALIHDVSQVLYLPFDYDDGSYARDRSGCQNDGIIYGATLTAGKIRMGRKFDGTDDYVEVADSPSLRVMVDYTIALWFKFDQIDIEGYRTLIMKTDGTNGWTIFLREYTDDLVFEAAREGVYCSFKIADIDLKWHYLVIATEPDVWISYIDGVEIARFTPWISDTGDTTNINLWIGKGLPAISEYPGMIDEPRIHKRVLSAGEIPVLMYRRLV